MEREVGGGIGMGNTCKPMAVSFQCMTKFTRNKKKYESCKKKKRKKKRNGVCQIHSKLPRFKILNNFPLHFLAQTSSR